MIPQGGYTRTGPQRASSLTSRISTTDRKTIALTHPAKGVHDNFRFRTVLVSDASAREIIVNHPENVLPNLLVAASLANVELEPGVIPAEWILSGEPETRSKILGRSRDWLAHVIVWECGAVSYKWHYDRDEAYIVISGEGFMTDEKGVERRFGPGDVAFFPAGTNATWRHPDHFKKVAVLKESVWRPLGLGLKAWNKLLRMVGVSAKSPLILALAAWTVWKLL